MLKQDCYHICLWLRYYNVTNIFIEGLLKITLPKIYSLEEIDSPAKFRLLGSKILLLEVTN